MLLDDLVHDKFVSRVQIVNRYNSLGLNAVTTLVKRKWASYHEYDGNKFYCSLTDLGAYVAREEFEIPASTQIVRGNLKTFRHTLLVGEMRHRLAEQNRKIASESSIALSTVRGEYKRGLLHPDIYLLGEDGVPNVAIEIDRGYKAREIRAKYDDWKERKLEVWWVADGISQYHRVSRQNLEIAYLKEASEIGLKAY
jgi:hypothetical protein